MSEGAFLPELLELAAGQVSQPAVTADLQRTPLIDALIELASDAIFITDCEGALIEVNACACHLLNIRREHLLGQAIAAILSADLWSQLQVILQTASLGTSQAVTGTLLPQGGTPIPVEINFKSLPDRRRVMVVKDLRDRLQAQVSLQHSEERLQLALRGAGQGIWDWDLHAQVLTWDERCKEIFGLPPDVSVSYDWHVSALHPDDRQGVAEAAAVALRDRTEFDQEYRTIHPDGSVRWVLARGRGYYDSAGNPYRMSGTVLDISDRKQAEIALRDREQQFQQMSDAMPQFVWMINAEGQLDYVNRQWLEYSGFTLAQTQDPEHLLRIYHPEDFEKVHRQWAIAQETQHVFEQEARLKQASDGTYRWFLIRGVPVVNDQGQIVRWYGTSTDIHARKRAEAHLAERSQHIQLLYETTRDLLSTDEPLALIEALFAKLKPLIGLDVYINYMLDSERQQLHLEFQGGLSPETVSQIEWIEMGQAICGTVAEQRTQVVQPHVQASTDPKAALIRDLGLTAYSCQPLIAQGNLFGTLGFGSRSRTEFTLAETNLFQAICNQMAIALERSELMTSLQRRTIELLEANHLKDEFLAALSHELRTPLNPIIGWTKLIKDQKLTPAKTAEAINIIDRNAKQQLALVNDLLDVSSIIQGKLSLKFQPIDLMHIVQAAIETVQFTAQAKAISIHVYLQEDEAEGKPPIALNVMGNRDRLQQVFWNLLSNAIKFTAEGGQVQVELAIVSNGNATRSAQVQVTDSGIGISPAFLPFVFDHFRQADASTTRKHGGLGLGLSIVRHLVELHGGTVIATSPGLDRGATFTVRLPLLEGAPPPVDEPDSPMADVDPAIAPLSDTPSPTPTTATPPGELAGYRILIVDDDPDNLDLLQFLLLQAGAKVSAYESPIAALQALTQDPPDLFISDIGMPGLNGYELIQQVRSLPVQQRHPTPAIALTAFAQRADQEQAIAAGFQAYIAKPVDPLKVIATILQVVS
jgi:PAS domain S-box-containing protein